MFHATLKSYATRAGGSLALAVALAAPIVVASPGDARQPPHPELGHATITGPAYAVDGDTLHVGGVRVRLEGIDAPEADQTCTDARGQTWACGTAATRAMAQLVAGQTVACIERGLDKYKRVLATCHVGSTDVSAELVRRGLAWAFVRYSQSYAGLEAQARRAKVGIWAGQAQPAWEYRSQRWQVAEVDAPKGCAIKGNVTAGGRIYHMPWSPWYGKIKMDAAKGKRWFCSEDEAVKAGWRPALTH